jgi:hypothetical protein
MSYVKAALMLSNEVNLLIFEHFLMCGRHISKGLDCQSVLRKFISSVLFDQCWVVIVADSGTSH